MTNDKYKVKIDWGDGKHKNKLVQIIRLEKHGLKTFARVRWLSKDPNTLVNKYGELFGLDELIKCA